MTEQQIEWVTVETCANQPLAEMKQEMLQQAGIPVVLVPGDAAAYMGAGSPFMVNVPADKLAEAKETLGD